MRELLTEPMLLKWDGVLVCAWIRRVAQDINNIMENEHLRKRSVLSQYQQLPEYTLPRGGKRGSDYASFFLIMCAAGLCRTLPRSQFIFPSSSDHRFRPYNFHRCHLPTVMNSHRHLDCHRLVQLFLHSCLTLL